MGCLKDGVGFPFCEFSYLWKVRLAWARLLSQGLWPFGHNEHKDFVHGVRLPRIDFYVHFKNEWVQRKLWHIIGYNMLKGQKLNTMKRLLLSTFLLLLLQGAAFSQSTFGFGLDAFIPTGDLKNDSPELWGGGFSMESVWQINDSPIHLGGRFSMLRYGSEVRNGWHGPDLGDVRVRRHNELANLMGVLRIKPEVSGMVQPYADFTAGFSYIYTRVRYRDNFLDDGFFHHTELRDFSFNYGLGGGLEIFVDETISIDISARTVRGSRADYFTPESVDYNPELEWYDMTVKSSRFDYMTISIGVKVLLDDLGGW